MVWSLCNQEGCLSQMHCPPLLLGSTILHHYSYGMQNLQIQCSDIHTFGLLVTKYYVLSLCKFPSFVNVSPGISRRVTLELTWSSWKSLILYIRETKCLKWWLKIKITTIVSTLLEKNNETYFCDWAEVCWQDRAAWPLLEGVREASRGTRPTQGGSTWGADTWHVALGPMDTCADCTPGLDSQYSPDSLSC